ncbi:DsbA family oxidoreductase [Schlesneria sp. T3-172]|uniref:DsbA family oxidoreductase n=1 Tax=Schlesneria sphaerica TaxID=3373610 RepID=UPI0037C9374C
MTLLVDVISDVICPWCFIGKRRLEKAIAEYGKPVQVRWHPYQLNPQMPREGIRRQEYRQKKFGSLQRSQELDAQVIAAGKEEGIAFDFDSIETTPNTQDAHRLIWLAEQEGIQDAVVEGLFRAYFTQGRNISLQAVILDVVTEAGLDRMKAESVLNGQQGLDVILQAGEQARRLHVTGVPCFIINRRMMVSGAQLPEAFLDAFQQAGADD